MRKAQLQAEITRLKDLNTTLARDRDGLLREVHDAVGSLRADVGGLRDKVFDQSKALTKVSSDLTRHGNDLTKNSESIAGYRDALTTHGEVVASLTAAVQASLLASAEEKAAAEPEVTPIASKRGTKATG